MVKPKLAHEPVGTSCWGNSRTKRRNAMLEAIATAAHKAKGHQRQAATLPGQQSLYDSEKHAWVR